MGPPDLAVEIISPTSRKIDQERKFALYARSGVPEYWLLDGVDRSLRMFRLDGDRYVAVEPTEGRLESTVIPGLVLDPAALFADIDDLVSE
jgi:Uma2 family endonuclease